MTEYTNLLYTYINDSNKNSIEAPYYNGMSPIKWVEEYLTVLNIYAITGDNKAAKIIEWYQNMINSQINKPIVEIYDYLIKYHHIPNRQSILLSNGEDMFEWLFQNKSLIKKASEAGNNYAKYVMIYIDNYKNIHTNTRINKGINNKSQYKYLFQNKLIEMINYLKINYEIPSKNSNVTFKNGSNMGLWMLNNKKYLLTSYLKGNEYAIYLVNLIIEINPYYFDTIKKNETFIGIQQSIKNNYQYVKRK